MKIGEIIKKRRKELGLTLKQVAEELGVSESLISRYESKDVEKLSIDKLIPLARILKTTPMFLIGLEPTELSADDKKIQEISNILQKNNNYILSKIKRGNKVDIIENEKIINTVDVEIIFNAYDNKFLKNEFSYQDIIELINLYDIPSELTGIARKQYINFISESAMFFDDDNISDDTKDKIALSMQKIFFLAKEKNKRKK